MSFDSIIKQIKEENKKLVTRFAPSPNAYCTLGHVKGMVLLQHVVENANGKLFLRFDDTNPNENYKKEYYDDILKTSEKLGIKYDKIMDCSDLGKYIKYGKVLVEKNKAFFCSCEPNKDCKKVIFCECSKDKKDFFNEPSSKYTLKYKGEKTNYVILRCINSKWYPTIAFQGPIDDENSGVNCIFRGRDLESLSKRQNQIYIDLFDKEGPKNIYWGRISLWNSLTNKKWEISKSLLKESNEFPSLRYFEKWGFSYESMKKFFISCGFTKNDIKIDIRKLFFFQIESMKKKSRKKYTDSSDKEKIKYVVWKSKNDPDKKKYGVLKGERILDLQKARTFKFIKSN